MKLVYVTIRIKQFSLHPMTVSARSQQNNWIEIYCILFLKYKLYEIQIYCISDTKFMVKKFFVGFTISARNFLFM
jgi:hypothetical protein